MINYSSDIDTSLLKLVIATTYEQLAKWTTNFDSPCTVGDNVLENFKINYKIEKYAMKMGINLVFYYYYSAYIY